MFVAHPFATPEDFLSAGASHCRAAIYPLGWCILSPHRNIFFQPAHPFAAPPSIHSAGASHGNATIFSFGWCIPLPHRHLFFWSFDQRIPLQRCNVFFWRVRSIAMWPLLIFWLAHSLAHGPLYYSGWRIQSPIAPLNIPAGAFYRQLPPSIFWPAHSLAHGPLYYSGWCIQLPIALFNIPAYALDCRAAHFFLAIAGVHFFAVFSTRPLSTNLPEHTVR